MSINCTPQNLANNAQGFFRCSRRLLEVIKAYLLCQSLRTGLLIPPDPVVSMWVANVVANGGPVPSHQTQNALTIFVLAIRACGVESQISSAAVFVPDSLIAATTPLYVGTGFNPWTNLGFVPSDLSLAGLTGDGIGKSLDTGVNPVNVFTTIAEGGLTIYVSVGNTNNTIEIELCCSVNATRELGLMCDLDQQANFWCYNQTTGKILVNAPNFSGYMSGNRVSLTNSAIYVASSTQPHSVLASIATSGGAIPNQTATFGVFCENNNAGNRNSFSTRTLSFAAIHHGLTQAQSLCFFNAIQTCRMMLGGGFV